jgi:hypothetical protein
MSEGLYTEGDKIFYNGQQVGEFTIPEGTSLHGIVTEVIISPYSSGRMDGYAEGYNKGRITGRAEVSDEIREGYSEKYGKNEDYTKGFDAGWLQGKYDR